MTWQFLLIDRFGTPLGELTDAVSRQVTLNLNRVPTGSFVVDTRHELVNYLRMADQTMVKAYRNGTLMALGPCVPGYQKSVGETSKTLQVSWSGIAWRLSRRAIEASKSATGVSYPSDAVTGGTMDQGAIVHAIIDDLNTVASPPGSTGHPSDTGIRVGTVVPTFAVGVGPWYYKNALEAISALSAAVQGFDWEVAPVEPTIDSLGIQLGTLNLGGAIGSYRQEVVWEYGDGKNNVASFTESSDFSGALNRAYHLPVDFPNNTADSVLGTIDIASVNARGNIYDDVIQADLTTADMRNKILAENVAIRKQPKQIITFTPTVDPDPLVMPQFGTDFIVGDLFRFRAVEYDVETVNGIFRCYGVTFNLDQEGNETATPTLVSQES